MCKWIGNGEGCNKEPVKGRSYCEEHLWRVYQKGTAAGTRKKDAGRAAAVWDLENEFNLALAELEEEGDT